MQTPTKSEENKPAVQSHEQATLALLAAAVKGVHHPPAVTRTIDADKETRPRPTHHETCTDIACCHQRPFRLLSRIQPNTTSLRRRLARNTSHHAINIQSHVRVRGPLSLIAHHGYMGRISIHQSLGGMLLILTTTEEPGHVDVSEFGLLPANLRRPKPTSPRAFGRESVLVRE